MLPILTYSVLARAEVLKGTLYLHIVIAIGATYGLPSIKILSLSRGIYHDLMWDIYQGMKLFRLLSTSCVREGPESLKFRNSSTSKEQSIEQSSEADGGGSLWLCLEQRVVVSIRCSDVLMRCITEFRRRTPGASNSSIRRRWVGIP